MISLRLLVVFVVLTGPAAAAPYLQHGVAPDRSGAVTGEGPASFGVALALNLSGPPAGRSPILILDGGVFAVVGSADSPVGQAIGTAPAAGVAPVLVRVDLDDGSVEEVVALPRSSSSVASDGTHIFVADSAALTAYAMDGWTEAWTTPFPSDAAVAAPVSCAPLAVTETEVVAACGYAPDTTALPGPGGGAERPDAFVVSVNKRSGAIAWTWRVPTTSGEGPVPQAGSSLPLRPHALAVAANRVIVSGIEGQNAPLGEGTINPNTATLRVYAIDRESGSLVWQASATNSDRGVGGQAPANTPETALATDGQTLYFLGWALRGLDLEVGDFLWQVELGELGVERVTEGAPYTGSAMALSRGRIYVTGFNRLHAFDATQSPPTPLWQTPIPLGDWEGAHTVLVVGSHVLAGGFQLEFFSTDVASGRVEFRDDLPASSNLGLRIAAGDGVVAYASPLDGSLRVLGKTNASIAPVVAASATYPSPGEIVRLDMGGTRPGVQHPDTQFSVDWADGVVTAWDAAFTAEHTYDAPGPRRVTVLARNAAGQTASATLDLDVGGVPPQVPTVLERAFARDNQDTTWGVIGLAAAAGGGVFAFARTRARRRRVQVELDAIEHAFVSNRDRTRQCEAALLERRAHVQGLGLDGRLDQADVLLLTQRVDELSRDLRIGTIDREFHFLPHGFVLSLKEMLTDGVISVWEHDHLLHALERDRSMTDDQKAKVRALLDEWASREQNPRKEAPDVTSSRRV